MIGLVISGCGGGSSSDYDHTSSAISSSTSSATTSSSSSSSMPTVIHLTIQGRAVADALVDGEVVFTIGTTDYIAKITDTLNYSIELTVPQQDVDKPFSAVATGSGVDDWVQLAASFPSIKNLAEKAGSDGVLDHEEYFGVNITTLTTTQYAEIKNQPAEIDSDESRTNAFLMMHPIRSLEKAAFISRMFSDIDFNLPPPAQTTLDFLLDDNLSETYLEAFRTSDFYWIDSHIAAIESDPSQSSVSPAKFNGTYFLDSLYQTYMINFNEDGTGRLKTASIDARLNAENSLVDTGFSWVRKAKQIRIQFSQPITYSTGYYILDNQYYLCGDGTASNDLCSITFTTINLDLITDTDSSRLAYLRYNMQVDNNGVTIEENISSSFLTRIISASDLPSGSRSDVSGYEWYTHHYRYVISDNGTGSKTNLITKTNENFDWEFKDNRIEIGSSTLWLINKNIAGYDIISVDESGAIRQPLFKRHPVNMGENDWIGRWQSYPFNMSSSIYDVNPDKTWRDGFEAEGAGSWSTANSHTQTAVANGAWRMDRDILAIHDERYYLSICQGEAATEFVASDCYLSVATKAPDFDSNVFWNYWSYPAFNEQISGNAWVPVWGSVFITDESGQSIVRPFTRISVNKLFSIEDKTIVEMTSAGKDHIELCEYQMFEVCNESEKQIYQRGIEVELVTIGQGNIYLNSVGDNTGAFYNFQRTVSGIFMIPRFHPQELVITTENGEELSPGDVMGCDGTLTGTIYNIPARTDGCEITVNFNN